MARTRRSFVQPALEMIVSRENIVAVGLLTQRDLDVLGQGFSRKYRVVHDDTFAALLLQLDKIDATPTPPDTSTTSDTTTGDPPTGDQTS